jgi:hypothetical protein
MPGSQRGSDRFPYPLDLDYRRFLEFSDHQLRLLTLHLLQKIDRRQTVVEHRLRNLELLLVRASEQVTSGFPRFRQLPTEIRCHVWEIAVPRRKLRPFHHYERELPSRLPAPFSGLPPPAVSQVCRESRSVALRRGGMFRLYFPWMSSQKGYWTWFDGSRDVLELSSWCLPGAHLAPIGLMEILRQAETVLVHMKHIHPSWVNTMFCDAQVRQMLRTMNVQRTHPEAVHKVSWDPLVVAKLFAIDSVAMVDLENPEEIKQIRELLSPNPERSRGSFDTWLKTWKVKEKKSRNVHTSTWAKQTFMTAWLRLFQGDDELRTNCLCVDGSINQAIPWIQDSMLRMPRIRPVYTFELGDNCLSFDSEPSDPALDGRIGRRRGRIGGRDGITCERGMGIYT